MPTRPRLQTGLQPACSCDNGGREAQMASGHIQGPKQALPDDLQSILNELDRTDQQVRELVSDLSEAQLNWQPGETAWSIAQCLDHLGQTNSVYTAALRTGERRDGG